MKIESKNKMESILQANWIWENDDFEGVNQHVVFCKKFDSPQVDFGKIAISCDSDFKLYLNGELIGKDQFPDYPKQKTYSVFELKNLKKRDNLLKVEAYYIGEDFFTYAKGKAGLIAALQIGEQLILTDESWQAGKLEAFKSGKIDKLTFQLGFVVEYDATKEDIPVKLHQAIIRDRGVNGFCQSLSERKLPVLVNSKKCSAEVIFEQPMFRQFTDNSKLSYADMVVNDKIVSEHDFANGKIIVGDLLQEEVGEFYLQVRAVENTVIDISHGEFLTAKNLVSNKIHNRNFTDRYICKEGVNYFVMSYRRVGCRYLQLNIVGDFELIDFGVYRMEQPDMEVVEFVTDNPCSTKLLEVALHTLKCCMHNHFEDCPWREQGLYAYDSRNQMLFNYYSFGHYEFVRESLRLLGDGLNRENGYLSLCAPTNYSITIPIFTMTWVVALNEYYRYSNDVSLLKRYQADLEFIYRKIIQNQDEQSGLYVVDDDKTLWNFYEWVTDLANTDEYANPMFGTTQKLESLFNIYCYEMLVSLMEIFRTLENPKLVAELKDVSEKLAQAIEKNFWDSEKQCYATSIKNHKFSAVYHEHVQVVMLKNSLVPEAKKSLISATIQTGDLTKVSFSPLLYYIDGMFALNSESRQTAVDLINRKFFKMIDEKATTFYETEDGSAAFDGAGSLCHAWSSIHTYYYGAKVLGVKPLTSGFLHFEVKPYTIDFGQASGEVPTPFGKIFVSWVKDCDDKIELEVKYPKVMTLSIDTYPECPISKTKTESY